jgi:tRNA G18 (ribose-2'-O)-methylase SpoU
MQLAARGMKKKYCNGASYITSRYTRLPFKQTLNIPKWIIREELFVMGAEDKGLEEFWRKSSDLIIKIPMLGHNDSLNVSVSAAVLLYETIRQRS